jgi:ferrochelatase
VDIPWLFRQLLLHLVILPFRTPKTTRLYQSIWTEQGSPLRVNSAQLAEKVQQALGDTWCVALGMRYGEPSLKEAVGRLAHCRQVVVLPLFPHYALSSTETALRAASKYLGRYFAANELFYITQFGDNPGFIQACAHQIKKHALKQPGEHILFSYHGLPNRQDSDQQYRAQCVATSEAIASVLGGVAYTTGFQSQMSKHWTEPNITDILLPLRQQGVIHLAVMAPGFVADCLETLEELNIRLRAQWAALGGDTFVYVPCLNDGAEWTKLVSLFSQEAIF